MTLSRRNLLALPAALCFSGTGTARESAQLGDHPSLDDKQLGHLRFISNIAKRRHNDWSLMDSDEPGQGNFDAYRYQLAMMAYTVHLANYHYTPAWREVHQSTSEKLVEKMMRFDVWSFWENVSRGAKQFDPSLAAMSEGWRDPVIKQNIMYSGHLFQMVTTYAMLYDSSRYEQAGALTFDFDPKARGMGREQFVYDTPRLAEVLRNQFAANGWAGIECEPNAIFVECNQHPMLGFKLLDQRKGTAYFPEVSAQYMKVFEEQQFFHPENGSSMLFKMVKQGRKVPAQLAWNDGWAGTFLHAWAPQKVREVYPKLRGKYVVRQADGTAVIPFAKASDAWSWGNGFIAVLAAETGDVETARAMLAYADRHWSPTWVDGGLHYPRNDDFETVPGRGNGIPERFSSPRVNTLTGNGLLGLARMNPGQGLFSMFERPWTREHFSKPYISGVAYPQVQVARAVYDDAKRALVVRLRPERSVNTGFSVHQLNAQGTHAVLINGTVAGRVRDGRATAAGSGLRMDIRDGVLALNLPLRATTEVVVQQLS